MNFWEGGLRTRLKKAEEGLDCVLLVTRDGQMALLHNLLAARVTRSGAIAIFPSSLYKIAE
jgi:hypothetical protein